MHYNKKHAEKARTIECKSEMAGDRNAIEKLKQHCATFSA